VIAFDIEPLSAEEVARRLGHGRLPCWLASPGAADLGLSWEALACDPVRVVRGSSIAALDDAWAEARARWRAGPEIPVAVGWLSYDLGSLFERLRGNPPPSSGWADLELRFYDAFWVREAGTGRCRIQAASPEAAAALRARLDEPVAATGTESPSGIGLSAFVPTESPQRHLAAVERALEYIRAGDVYQVNLARRLRARCQADGPPGLTLFSRLRAQAPAPHALWLGDADQSRALIGNSPERFLRVTTDGQIETCPIKGTRPRGRQDSEVVAELRAAKKDRAEHVMIVDVERNDLGRVCRTGSVEVLAPARVMSLPTVHHLVTTVRGQLRPGVALADLLRATFPGGSVTGAPKIRAMEIIDELEAGSRGPYTGATGWLGAAGDLDLAVAIRTALLHGQDLTLWVGGGIVADSEPEAELAETESKAEAFTRIARGERDERGDRRRPRGDAK
jgi:anthranilate/para-aminobenzoate synthase component I